MKSLTRAWCSYLFAVSAACVALLVTQAVSPGSPDRSPVFLAAVIVSAWYGGLGPGLVTTCIAAAIKAYSALPLRGSLPFHDGATILHFFVFVSVALLVSSLTGALRRAEQANHALAESERAARLQAQAANRMKDVFLAKVSHELRTPLQATSAWAQVLGRSRRDDPAFDTALVALQRSIAAQSSLIDELLTASRVIAGKMHLELRPVRLGPVVEAAVNVARAAAPHPQPIVAVCLDPEVDVVAGDAARLEQVVSNLVSNALKFTPASGRVEVRLEAAEQAARIVVTDTGRGIAPDLLPHLFDEFWQGRHSGPGWSQGLGLGLAIVRQLVELHGGVVHADSGGLDAGATFTVTLPIERDVRPPTAPAHFAAHDRASACVATHAPATGTRSRGASPVAD